MDLKEPKSVEEKPELQLPSHAIWIHWKFESPPLEDQAPTGLSRLEFLIDIHNDPPIGVGSYLCPYNATIDGAAFYFGIQTDVLHPDLGHGIGKGLIFSTWWSFDLADLRTEGEDGFFQQGTHEGNFIGVRRPFDWTIGRYNVVLERTSNDEIGDWFTLSICRADADSDAFVIGSLRFPRQNALVPATIRRDGITFLEVYSGAQKFAEIEDWDVSITATGDGVQASSARSEYPSFPFAEVPCSDAFADLSARTVRVAYGKNVVRAHSPAVLW
jgi:hypothetical protein